MELCSCKAFHPFMSGKCATAIITSIFLAYLALFCPSTASDHLILILFLTPIQSKPCQDKMHFRRANSRDSRVFEDSKIGRVLDDSRVFEDWF